MRDAGFPFEVRLKSVEEHYPEDIEIQTVNIMEDLARGVPRESLLAARVKGDSMIDVYIYPDDIVVFAKGIISGDGIYVLSIVNDVGLVIKYNLVGIIFEFIFSFLILRFINNKTAKIIYNSSFI